MKDNSMENRNVDVAGIQSRLSQLRERSAKATGSSDKKRKLFLIVGVTLVLLCAVCLARLCSLARQLDANALAEIGRLQVEKHLPESRGSIEEHLKREAPKLVGELLSTCMDVLPTIRERFVEDLTKRLDTVTEKYEEEFGEQMVDAIRLTKENLDRAVPGASDTEKMERLIDHVCKDFERGFKDGLSSLYPNYVAEVERVNEGLKQLAKTDNAKLTERERTEKEIIETFLRLMLLEQKKSF